MKFTREQYLVAAIVLRRYHSMKFIRRIGKVLVQMVTAQANVF